MTASPSTEIAFDIRASADSVPPAERERETKRLQTKFDFALADLYAKVADEFPGERKKKARPLSDPR